MKPEIVGPRAGAAEITTPTRPITVPRLRSGTRARVVVISSGSTIVVPAACTTRAINSTPKVGANVATSVPARNSNMAEVNMARTLRRFMRNPVVRSEERRVGKRCSAKGKKVREKKTTQEHSYAQEDNERPNKTE